MIIHQPEIIVKDGYAILWARLEMVQRIENFPEYLWYRVPERYAPILNTQSDAFLAASLLAGMYYGEEIHVRGTTSPKLAYHLDEYQFLLKFRMTNILHQVKISYSHLDTIKSNPAGVGSLFSGGVDSLYTIWKHLPQNQPIEEYQVTHGIFIRGFDILHTEREIYRQLYTKFQKHTSNIGIDLIEMDTNMNNVTHQMGNYIGVYGSLLISVGLSLSGLFKRFYISSSDDYYWLQDHILQEDCLDSDPLADGFLSTDTMEIIHYGSMSRRVEKTEQIMNWEVAQDILWVCQQTDVKESAWNCSRCEKCLRSMTSLYTLGALEKFPRFKKPFHNNWEILWYARKFNKWSKYYFFDDLYQYMKNHRYELIPWLYIATFLGTIRYWLVKYSPRWFKLWLRRFGYFRSKDEAPDSYDIHEINDIIKESIMD